MKAAQQLGISLRRFEGWTPAEVTTHEYDDGRLVRSVTTVESEWDDTQQDWMLALLEYEAGICRGCGQPMHLSTVEDHDWQVDPIRCWTCDAIAQAQEKDKRLRPQALHWYTRRR